MSINLNFEKCSGLVPAVVQNSSTGEVLMVGFMNKEAFEKTKTERRVVFYSRSKERLWMKGETTGNFLNVDDILADCDNDTILILATPAGPTCHTGTRACFLWEESPLFLTLSELQEVIHKRNEGGKPGSYTFSLFNEGISKIAQKVGEEATELIVAALTQKPEEIVNECADLLYHSMVLLQAKGVDFRDVLVELKRRRNVNVK